MCKLRLVIITLILQHKFKHNDHIESFQRFNLLFLSFFKFKKRQKITFKNKISNNKRDIEVNVYEKYYLFIYLLSQK